MITPPASGSLINPQDFDGFPPSGGSPPQKLVWFRTYFRPHFDDWVFGPIDRLVHAQDALIGFIFMACAIDYLAGFWWGKSTKRNVEKVYVDFMNQYFPEGRYDAKGFYDSLRNGLVHLFTIKNKKYALTHNNPHLHLKGCAQDFVGSRCRWPTASFRSRPMSSSSKTRAGFTLPRPLTSTSGKWRFRCGTPCLVSNTAGDSTL
jgi:hypothetical protein